MSPKGDRNKPEWSAKKRKGEIKGTKEPNEPEMWRRPPQGWGGGFTPRRAGKGSKKSPQAVASRLVAVDALLYMGYKVDLMRLMKCKVRWELRPPVIPATPAWDAMTKGHTRRRRSGLEGTFAS